jgi:hypothetical protein
VWELLLAGAAKENSENDTCFIRASRMLIQLDGEVKVSTIKKENVEVLDAGSSHYTVP